jgi:D-beta-D-heptose 7-phosphate kinase/D-beta-D-heptose 1-phosphate adenosyltransferase
MGTILSTAAMVRARRTLKRKGLKVVFTNGTFDILHRGHVSYLQAARKLGDCLVVGLNTDASIRRIKGPKRPINPNRDRAEVLAALGCVDFVVLFGDDTPYKLIKTLVPDVLVKGADWKKGEIVGGDVVEAHGGSVRRIRLVSGRSTTNVIQRVLDVYSSSRTGTSRAR